jgi:hypothetical protein
MLLPIRDSVERISQYVVKFLIQHEEVSRDKIPTPLTETAIFWIHVAPNQKGEKNSVPLKQLCHGLLSYTYIALFYSMLLFDN